MVVCIGNHRVADRLIKIKHNVMIAWLARESQNLKSCGIYGGKRRKKTRGITLVINQHHTGVLLVYKRNIGFNIIQHEKTFVGQKKASHFDIQ